MTIYRLQDELLQLIYRLGDELLRLIYRLQDELLQIIYRLRDASQTYHCCRHKPPGKVNMVHCLNILHLSGITSIFIRIKLDVQCVHSNSILSIPPLHDWILS
jgi:hypothetical protein